jgi:hypothetical protein
MAIVNALNAQVPTSSQSTASSSQFTASSSQQPTALDEHHARIRDSRKNVTVGQEKYRKTIEKLNIKNMSTHKIGDLVLLYVDAVDRSKSSPNNLLCIVMEEKNNSYRLGCLYGALDRWYHSNAFRPTDHVNHEISLDSIAKRDPNIKSTKKNPDKNNYVTINGIDYISLSIRHAMDKVSLGGGQGFVRCSCSRKCKDSRCSCKKAGIGCNTKCHPATSKMCENKIDKIINETDSEEDSDN